MFAVRGSGWLVSKIGFPYSRDLDKEEMEFVNSHDLAGYILNTRVPYQLSNIFITGLSQNFTHVEQLIGNNESIGGLTGGVTKRKIEDILKKVARYAILKPKFATKEEMQHAVEVAIEMERLGLDYDFDFDRDNDNIYCSEIPVEGYAKYLRGRYGSIIRPHAFYSDVHFWECIYEVDKLPKAELHNRERA